MQTRLVNVLGFTGRVLVDSRTPDSFSSDFDRAWRRCLLPHARATSDFTVGPEATRHGVSHALTVQLTEAALALHRGRAWSVHAGAVAHPTTGATTMVIGPSGAGKTTAVATLARAWGYVSDEAVVVTNDGEVLAYPKPLSVRTDGVHKAQVAPDDVGLVAAPAQLQLRTAVLLDRVQDAALRTEDLSLPAFIAAAAPECSYLTSLPRPLRTIAHQLRGVRLLRATYAEAEQLLDLLEPAAGVPR